MRRRAILTLGVLAAALLLGGCAGIREQASEFRDQVAEMKDHLHRLEAAETRNASLIGRLEDRVAELQARIEVLSDQLAQETPGSDDP